MLPKQPVQFVDLKRQHHELGADLFAALKDVMNSSSFILSDEVEAFEEEFATYCGTRFCVGVGSGLDALSLTLRTLSLRPGDEVILPGNTFIATALAVSHAGGTPVLVDHEPLTYNIDVERLSDAITSRTRAVIAVHLYGRAADMESIRSVAANHDIIIIEDAAQAHGAIYNGRRCGAMGLAGCFSFYPGKNLGALGDAGAVVTNDSLTADRLRKLRNYGSIRKYYHEVIGFNSRLDSVQAAVLRIKLRHLDRWNGLRREAAASLCSALSDLPIVLPSEVTAESNVNHIFPIRCGSRDSLLEHLQGSGVQAGIHYPIPIHQQLAYQDKCLVPFPLRHTESFAPQLLSLPIHPHLSNLDLERVVDIMHSFSGDMAIPATKA